MLEATHNGTSAADCWRFHYYVVRDAEKKPILATFFTDAIWKNDVFSAAEVSRALRKNVCRTQATKQVESSRWGRS